MPRNVEVRERVTGSFGHADSLLYPKTTKSMVVGLLDASGKIAPDLIPDWLLGTRRYLMTWLSPSAFNTAGALTDALIDFENIINDGAWDATIQAMARGMYIVIGAAMTLTVSTGHTIYSADDGVLTVSAGGTITLEINDYLVIENISGGSGFSTATTVQWSVINNTHGLATTSVSGLMSSTDKTKLDGIAAGANNYSHPAYTARSIDTDGIEVLDTFTSDATGHVTGVAKRSLPAATGSTPGVMSAVDKSKLDGIELNANNYTHPTGGANTTLTLATNETIAGLTVNSLGHVTAATKQTIRTGTTSQTGILQLATGTELTTSLSTTKALTPTAVKTMIDYFAGMIRYANLTAANAATHNDGAIVLVTVA